MPPLTPPSDDDAPDGGSASLGREAPSDWKRRASRNTAALGVARGVTAVLVLGLTAYLTRVLGPSGFGILGFGAALLTYFQLLVTLGFNVWGTREIARAPDQAAVLAGRITGLKLVLSVVAYAGFLAVTLLLPKDSGFKLVLAVQGGVLFGYAISVEWAFQGLERMGLLAVRNVAAAVLYLASVLLLVRSSGDVVLAAACQVGSLLVLNGWLLGTFLRAHGRIRLRAGFKVWRAMLGPALPIAASSFMVTIYYSLDQVMLGVLRSEAEVGWYTASYRLVTALLIPATVITQAFFPILSRALGDLAAMRERSRAYAAAMLPVGVPLAVGAGLLAEPLLVLFAGPAYAPGAVACRLLLLNAGLVYVNMAYGQTLLAWDRQKTYLYVVGAGALANAVLNVALIPSFGIEGAATATLLSEAVVWVGVVAAHARLVQQYHGRLLARTALVTAATALPLWGGTTLGAPLPVAIGAAAAGYLLSLWALGLLPQALLRMLRSPSPRS